MSRSIQRGRLRSRGRRRRESGQTLVEFALVLPLFMLVLTAIIEFGFLFNSYLAINFASREASLVAAEAGSLARADCLILDAVERSIGVPADRDLITRVQIYRADRAGNRTAEFTTYVRGGPMSCLLPGGATLTVPYQLSGRPGYPPSNRCNSLAGCSVLQPGVDQIGVEVTYAYGWHTPLGDLFGGSGGTTTLVQGNVMRMEPLL